MKIVINKCYGGFGLSAAAITAYLKLIGKEPFFYKEDYDKKVYFKVSESEYNHYCVVLTKDYGKTISNKNNMAWNTFNADHFSYNDIPRNDKNLIAAIEAVGEHVASANLAKLKIVELPDDVKWEIDDYDGIEAVHELHRSW